MPGWFFRKLEKDSMPLQRIEKFLQRGVEKIIKRKNELAFKSVLGETSIKMVNSSIATVDGSEISGIFLIETQIPPDLDVFDDQKMAAINAMACFSAVIRDSSTEGHRIVSRLTGYRNDEGAWDLYSKLVASAALFQSLWVVSTISGKPISKASIGDESHWKAEEFANAANRLSSLGLMAMASEESLGVELPLRREGESVMSGDQTCLITISAGEQNPILGHGLFFKLSLPIAFDRLELAEVCNSLNVWEYRAVDAPPFFGAWCPEHDAGVPAFVGFWPNIMYHPGTVLNHAVWMMHRSKMIHAYLVNNGIGKLKGRPKN